MVQLTVQANRLPAFRYCHLMILYYCQNCYFPRYSEDLYELCDLYDFLLPQHLVDLYEFYDLYIIVTFTSYWDYEIPWPKFLALLLNLWEQISHDMRAIDGSIAFTSKEGIIFFFILWMWSIVFSCYEMSNHVEG